MNDSFETKELTYRIKIYRPNAEIIEYKAGTTQSLANVNVEADAINFDEIAADNLIVFFELYDGETLVSRARWYDRWLVDLTLPCAKLSASVDKTAKTITVTCDDGIALGVAFDGRFVAEDNFIDLLEGETRTIAFTPHDNFDGVTVYCYNASKFNKP